MTQQEKETTPAPKKFPFFSFSIAILLIIAIAFAVYYALFPNTPIPFLSKDTQNTISKALEKPSNFLHSMLDPAEENTKSQSTPTQENKNYNTANEIFDLLTNTPPKELQEQNSLNEVNMAEENTNSDATNATTSDNADDFIVQPPSEIPPLEGGRKMLTEEEIREAQEQDRKEKLAKLEKLRNQTINLTEEELASLPSGEGRLTSLMPEDSLDPVVTLFFIQDLGTYLVNNYKKTASGEPYIACSMPKLNQHYGLSLTGLEHDKGRKGVLEYAYNEAMIGILYEHLHPALIACMKQQAQMKGLSIAEQKDMFNQYAKMATRYATAIHKIINIPQLQENIQNLLYLENDLKVEEDYFAENLLGFEQNKANPSLSHNYQENIKNSTIRSEQLRQRLSSVKHDLKQYLINYDADLATVSDLLELTLWLQRRNDSKASSALAVVLADFATKLENIELEEQN